MVARMFVEAAETASNGWGPGETIALVAVIVTGLGAVVSIVTNHLQTGKRLDHEKALQRERLAHQRREAVSLRAAQAYGKAVDVCAHVNPNRINQLANDPELVTEAGQLLDGLLDELAIVEALGDEQVRVTALRVADYLDRLVRAADHAAINKRQNSQMLKEATQKLDEVFAKADAVVDAYRDAIARD